MARAQVVLRKATDYDVATLRAEIGSAVELLGGWGRWVRRGDRVLVKPNCIAAATADEQAVTHPAFVVEICRQLLDFGAKPFVGDSPAWGSLAGVARKCGLTPMLKRLGVPLVSLNRPMRVENASGRVFRHFTLDRKAVEADVILNVPKLKAHCQLYVTFAIKNMFGCVCGKRKAWWHFKAGTFDNYFARMLCEVYALLNPALTIMDAIVGMEGQGPRRGTPRPIGAILVSSDAPAIERIACELIGADPRQVRTLRAAAELGIGTPQREHIELIGDPLDAVRISDFQFPRMVPIGFSFPRLVRSTLSNAWILRQEAAEGRHGPR